MAATRRSNRARSRSRSRSRSPKPASLSVSPKEIRKEIPSKTPEKEYQELLKTRGAGETKLQKLITRVVFGTLLFAFLLVLLWAGHLYVSIFVILIQVGLFKELVNVRYNSVAAQEVPYFRTLQWGYFVTAMFYTYGDLMTRVPELARVMSPQMHRWLSFSLYVFLFCITVLTLKKGYYKYQMSQLTWTCVSVALVVFQTSVINYNVYNGLFWFVCPCFMIIANDTFAYFAGLTFGKKIFGTPFLALSPNKTWEGFIGGGICTAVLAFFLPTFLNTSWFICPVLSSPLVTAASLECIPHYVFIPQVYELPAFLVSLTGQATATLLPVQLHSLLLSGFASLVAPFGGFFASAIKRAYGIKDFDSLIPGHGGIMDRMDCQLLMALCVAVHYSTFIQPRLLSVGTVVSALTQFSPEELQLVATTVQELMASTQ